jgi:iron complex outermembrane receptor protein
LAPPGLATFGGETSRASLQYQWSDAIMTYVSFADGFGPGGQSNLNPNQFGCHPDIPVGPRVFPSEDLQNYEIGLRADWLDERVRTNLTVFTLDWKNIQVTQYVASAYADLPQPCTSTGPSAQQIDRNLDGQPDILAYAFGYTTTAEAAKVQGVEFEGVWSPTDALRLSVNLGFLDTEYTAPGTAAIGALPAVTRGDPFPQAPELTANLGLQYRFQLANGGMLTPRLDYTFTDDYVLSNNLPNQRTQSAFGLVNARLTYDSGEAWSLSLFGTNLTNEYYQNSGFYSLAEQTHFVTIGRPREIGANLTYAFR